MGYFLEGNYCLEFEGDARFQTCSSGFWAGLWNSSRYFNRMAPRGVFFCGWAFCKVRDLSHGPSLFNEATVSAGARFCIVVWSKINDDIVRIRLVFHVNPFQVGRWYAQISSRVHSLALLFNIAMHEKPVKLVSLQIRELSHIATATPSASLTLSPSLHHTRVSPFNLPC